MCYIMGAWYIERTTVIGAYAGFTEVAVSVPEFISLYCHNLSRSEHALALPGKLFTPGDAA